MATHTPGPWKVQRTHKTRRAIRSTQFGETCVIAVVHSAGNDADCTDIEANPDDEVPWDTADANARLIAAAPELLEALKGILRVADRKTDEFDAARAAIAKATDPSDVG